MADLLPGWIQRRGRPFTLWARRYDVRDEHDVADALGVSSDESILFVTGRSRTGDGDYATVAYDTATAVELWAARLRRSGDGRRSRARPSG